MSDNGMEGDNRSANIGESADSSAIQTGDGNTATITNYYYYYREVNTVVSVESTDAADDNLPCPYRGLFHFGPDNAEYFFGREVFVEELFTATQSRNFIPLLGASGSGKSSVVLAGLVPKLQKEGNWLFTHFRPGKDPFYALAEALVPLYRTDLDSTDEITQADKLAEYLIDKKRSLNNVFSKIKQKYPNHRLLLIADQFEEIYTLCADNKIRHRFLDTLLASFQSSSSQSEYSDVLVTTMRADFLGNALSYRPFADVLQNADIKLAPMNREELTQVIEKPADKLGVSFQAGLVERILHDVDSEPGNLPLLEFALTELWKRRKGKQLTHAAYEEIGEVQGSLARHADENYRKLSEIEREQVRRIFIQLVLPGEDTEDTRRLATKAELTQTNWGLVKQLADARLVVTSRNAANQETVEVVHEALIRNWDELRQWIEADRSFRLWQERLRVEMNQWEQMQRDEGPLLRGKVLAEAEEKLKQRRDQLSKAEKEFIRVSVALRQRGKQRIYLGFGGIGSIFLLALGIWGLWNSPWGQLTRIRWKLTDVSQQTKDSLYKSEAAIAFAEDENIAQALKLVNQIENLEDKVRVLSYIGGAILKLNQPQQTASLLNKAIASANQIPNFRYKAQALSDIAQVYGNFNKMEAYNLLDKARDTANQIPDSGDKAVILSSLAQAYSELEKSKTAVILFNEAIDNTNQMKKEDFSKKTSILRVIIQDIGKFNQREKALILLNKAIESLNEIEQKQNSWKKAYALIAIAQAYENLNPEKDTVPFFDKAIGIANQLNDSEKAREKARVLRKIAQGISKLKQPEKATALFDKVIASANKINEGKHRTTALRAIAGTIGKLNEIEQASTLLEKVRASAKQIPNSDGKVNVLNAIAQAYIKINQAEATNLFDEAIIITKENFYSKAFDLIEIGKAYEKLDKAKAAILFDEAINTAKLIINTDDKDYAIEVTGEAAANLKNWGLALKVTEECPSEECKVQVLSEVLKVNAKQKHPELKQKEEE